MASPGIPPDRTLHEWYNYIEAERRQGVNWRTRLWWIRQWMYRTGTLDLVRTWWKNARKESSKYAALVEKWTGLTPHEQLAEMARLKIRHGTTPADYYSYRLYRPDRQEKAMRYVGHNRQVRLIRYLIENVYPEDRPTGDKRVWHRWAAQHDVPTPRVLATFSDGEITPWDWDGDPASLPPMDLFCKWTNLYQGKGAECWLFEDGAYVDMQNRTQSMTGPNLIRHFTQKSFERPLILQDRVRPHAKLEPFTSGALPTARLVTGRFPGEEPQPITAVFKIPMGNVVVDNISADGNLAVPVDIKRGRLGPAITSTPDVLGDTVDAHPDTNCKINGEVVPHWKGIVQLARSTHAMLREIPFVGWDVTLTREGPIIIEPNNGWGAAGIEKASGTPLTDTLYQPMYDAWMWKLTDSLN